MLIKRRWEWKHRPYKGVFLFGIIPIFIDRGDYMPGIIR